MSYANCCDELYRKRVEKENKRKNFIEARLASHRDNVMTNHSYRVDKPIAPIDGFVMPDILPSSLDALKWLIFQNIEAMNKNKDRTKECKDNIKKIKEHTKTLS